MTHLTVTSLPKLREQRLPIQDCGCSTRSPTAAHSDQCTVMHCSCPLGSRVLNRAQHDEPRLACSNKPSGFPHSAPGGVSLGPGTLSCPPVSGSDICPTILLHGSCTETGQLPPLCVTTLGGCRSGCDQLAPNTVRQNLSLI